ncbi:MAG: nucleoside deaminase [Candidatus Marinimicrobia bacterium]|nr:nucleoside deaminase [Candidatus Neomarinimicrobiota bacterium]
MKLAYREAEKALEEQEVPVGAVIVKDNVLIARGHNQVEGLQDPTAHAEMIAITAACGTLGEKRLEGCTLYVTLEPCPMCAGAMILAKLDTCVYAAADPKAGACDSLYHLCEDPRLNHRVKIVSGVQEEPCTRILQHFFKEKR